MARLGGSQALATAGADAGSGYSTLACVVRALQVVQGVAKDNAVAKWLFDLALAEFEGQTKAAGTAGADPTALDAAAAQLEQLANALAFKVLCVRSHLPTASLTCLLFRAPTFCRLLL